MTTPNSSPGSVGGVMENELTMTKAAAGAFEATVKDLNAIYNTVTDANATLNGSMISQSSTLWQQNTGQWTDDFQALVGNLQSITNMLNQQVTQMQQNEANNIELTGNVGEVGNGAALS